MDRVQTLSLRITMELRNRAAARRDVPGPAHDVSLGPTIYAGERYSKASERLRRQNKTGVVVNGDRVRHSFESSLSGASAKD